MKAPSAVSNQWGSYFVDVHKGAAGEGEDGSRLTWCCHCIHQYSTMAIPSVEHIAGEKTHTHSHGPLPACSQMAFGLINTDLNLYLVLMLAKLLVPLILAVKEVTSIVPV